MAPRVVVVGLGPAGPELIDRRTQSVLADAGPEHLFARTDRHPAAAALGRHRSFDEVYQAADSLEGVYPSIVERLVAEAEGKGRVVYAVPGSPLVAERSVELLRSESGLEVEVHPALSFLDLVWARLGVDPLALGVRLVDGQRFATGAAGERGPLLVAQCDSADVLSEIKLSVEVGPAEPVVVLQRLGLPDESVVTLAWDELDRCVHPDHLTSLWIPSLAPPVGAELARFGELVHTLRRRCPWDRAQTHASLRRYLVEEAYEVLDVLDRLAAATEGPGRAAAGPPADIVDDPPADIVDDLEDELGDLLFQIVFHAELAAERGWFTLADVARAIHDKLVRRHPHVFGDVVAGDAGAVVRNWDRIKGEERTRKAGDGRTGPFDGVPRALPALAYASKVLRRAPAAPPGAGSVEAARAPLEHLLQTLSGSEGPSEAAEVGELLFAAVELARRLGVDAEEALRLRTENFRAEVEAQVTDPVGDVR